jgi:alpha-1,3/alpha-1,6-mannosyltransferase
VALWNDHGSTDLWILDQVPLPLALLSFLGQKTIFYCHFPDCLLARHETLLQKLYRLPIDYIEESSIGLAGQVLVNSRFTEVVFSATFKRLYAKGICPKVVYPTATLLQKVEKNTDRIELFKLLKESNSGWKSGDRCYRFFLSINRFDSKKNLKLAILAFHVYLNSNRNRGSESDILVLAGGFDPRLSDNINVISDLRGLAIKLSLSDKIFLLPSISGEMKHILLSNCLCVLYTPENEHFGIVPLEAMQCGKPVIACKSGGPMETVIHGATGFLCQSLPEDFANAMSRVSKSMRFAEQMGANAKQLFEDNFSQRVFNETIQSLLVFDSLKA